MDPRGLPGTLQSAACLDSTLAASADVATRLLAGQVDGVDDSVCALTCLLHADAERRHTEHAAAGRHDAAVLLRGAGMKHHDVVVHGLEAADHVAGARFARIARCGHHHAHRNTR